MSHCICRQPLNLIRFHLFGCTYGVGEDGLAWYYVKYFYDHYKKCKISCLMKIDPCLFAPYLTIFMLLNWHSVITLWCPHVGRCYHRQPHSNWFGFMRCCFSRDCTDSCDLDKKWSLLQLILNKRDSLYNYRSFQIFTLTSRHVPSLMWQHNVINEGH